MQLKRIGYATSHVAIAAAAVYAITSKLGLKKMYSHLNPQHIALFQSILFGGNLAIWYITRATGEVLGQKKGMKAWQVRIMIGTTCALFSLALTITAYAYRVLDFKSFFGYTIMSTALNSMTIIEGDYQKTDRHTKDLLFREALPKSFTNVPFFDSDNRVAATLDEERADYWIGLFRTTVQAMSLQSAFVASLTQEHQIEMLQDPFTRAQFIWRFTSPEHPLHYHAFVVSFLNVYPHRRASWLQKYPQWQQLWDERNLLLTNQTVQVPNLNALRNASLQQQPGTKSRDPELQKFGKALFNVMPTARTFLLDRNKEYTSNKIEEMIESLFPMINLSLCLCLEDITQYQKLNHGDLNFENLKKLEASFRNLSPNEVKLLEMRLADRWKMQFNQKISEFFNSITKLSLIILRDLFNQNEIRSEDCIPWHKAFKDPQSIPEETKRN